MGPHLHHSQLATWISGDKSCGSLQGHQGVELSKGGVSHPFSLLKRIIIDFSFLL